MQIKITQNQLYNTNVCIKTEKYNRELYKTSCKAATEITKLRKNHGNMAEMQKQKSQELGGSMNRKEYRGSD